MPDTSHLPTFKKERKVIFQDDFSQYRAGTFPGKWKIEHNVQDARSKDEWIVEKNDGSNVLKSKVSDNHYVIAQNILNSYIRNDF